MHTLKLKLGFWTTLTWTSSNTPQDMPLVIGILGDSNVGKTELFRHLAEAVVNNVPLHNVSVEDFKRTSGYPNNSNVIHTFRSSTKDAMLSVRSNHTRKYWPTVAPVFETFQISGQNVSMWDVSGNSEFCRLAYAYEGFRAVDGFVLCYDMTSKESFDNLSQWYQKFVLATRRGDQEAVPFVVVGTKADFEEGRKVAHGTVAEFCDIQPGTRFFEVSTRVPGEGASVLRVFEDLVSRCEALRESDGNSSGDRSSKAKGASGVRRSEAENDVWLDDEEKKGKEGGPERGCADECVIS